MLSPDQIEHVIQGILGFGYLMSPRCVRMGLPQSPEGVAGLEGEIQIADQLVTLRIVLGNSFPLVLPKIYLIPWDTLGFIPHVSPDGYVCYGDSQGMVLDRRNPAGITHWALDRAIEILARGVTDKSRRLQDFADEFLAYWRLLPGQQTIESLVEPSRSPRKIVIVRLSGSGEVIADAESAIRAYGNVTRLKSVTLKTALYVPLEPGASVIPPRYDRPFWTPEEIRNWVNSATSHETKQQLDRFLPKGAKDTETVVFGLPRPSGGTALFGVRYGGMGDIHPLHASGTARKVASIMLNRRDRSYIVPRGGSTTNFVGTRALVIGAGAVGGHVTLELARAGISDISVVDHDKLSVDNIFRHILGLRYIGQFKADAIKSVLEDNIPYIKATSIVGKIQELILNKGIDLAAYDIVVSALGNPTLELEINERLHGRESSLKAVFAWVEPYGIGGHTLLTGEGKGCFECLYTSPVDGVVTLDNRAAFAGANQTFGRELSGCGTLFTPYGSIDAVRTAINAVSLVVRALSKKELGNPLESWKGDASDFLEAGFVVAPRYLEAESVLAQQRYSYAVDQCRVCGTISANANSTHS